MASTPARSAKVAALADLLGRLVAAEVMPAVAILAGPTTPRQGRHRLGDHRDVGDDRMRLSKWLRLGPAVLLLVASCSGTHKAVVAPTATTTSTSMPTSSTVVAPGSSTTGVTTPTTVSAGGPLPAGFTVADLSWVSDAQGWALGTAPCAKAPCTSVAHTVDGGRTWSGLPAPKAYLQVEFPPAAPSPPCSATVACVQGIRFANASTGYAFGVSSLWVTTDGGQMWNERSTDGTEALEIVGSTVFRVTHPGPIGCPPGCPYQVQAATVGSTSWRTLPVPAVSGFGVALAANGANLYLAAFGHTAGGAGDAHTAFAHSSDSGAHWSGFADPCGVTADGSEADATAISAAQAGNLAVACTPRGSGGGAFVVLSANAGATFEPHRGGVLMPVASGEAIVQIAAATGQRLAVVVIGYLNAYISVSNDAGADWAVTRTEATPPTGLNTSYLGFEDATTGRAVMSPQTILTTTDGGGHWTPFTFPS